MNDPSDFYCLHNLMLRLLELYFNGMGIALIIVCIFLIVFTVRGGWRE